MTIQHRQEIHNAIRLWMASLDSVPGWREWNKKKMHATMFFDGVVPVCEIDEFIFPDKIEKQHEIVMSYFYLEDSILDMKNVEFYFRRYPFRGLPISRYSHITNVCEMYFNKFYEFSERTKKHFEKIKKYNPETKANFGKFISRFKKEFECELKERNLTHHHRKFQDISIDRLFITDVLSDNEIDKNMVRLLDFRYREVRNEWVNRVRARSAKAELYLNSVADFTVKSCDFLRIDV
ncbi:MULTISPECIES: hypothetical protein [unclassified Azospirillum]|uniref:hypothetical protein n=1 Tax=unclassified Azospirillum TaxID=2630922 RepID=UPI000B65D064|nr:MULTISPECIES: hypothetical protein [unclassified Azospirillum]SNS30768.1 hypothetical protein SAMN05880556_103410 [Azospirillum sp. RU38E]SNS49187.1 hypothetical protein SAMN05880591_103410 [Azospirillum sp. RU37A]